LTKLPSISWMKLIKVYKKVGYLPTGQSGRRIIVPRHDPIGKGLLIEIIAEVGLTKEELLKLLEEV